MSLDPEALLKKAIRPKWRTAAEVAELYLVAFIGGWIAHWIDFPAAWLTGSLLAVALFLFAGRNLSLPDVLRDGGMVAVGLVLGTGFSPETLHAIASWPLSILMLFVTVVIITWAAYEVLRKIGKWDHATALFASLPGALSYVMVIAEEAGADMTRVAIAQTIRVFALISILPILLTPFSPDEAGTPIKAASSVGDGATLGLVSIILMVLPLLILVPLVIRFRVPAGLLLCGMFTSGTLYLTGTYSQPLPDWITIPGFLTVGIMIGCRFGAISLSDLLRLSGISLLSLFVSVAVSVGAAFLGAKWLGFPVAQVFLAFAPGGFETMVLLSFLFDLNPAYVAGHHLVRYLGLVLLAPLITARLTRKS